MVGSGSGIQDPGSGIRDGEKSGSGIRDKHPGSATLQKRLGLFPPILLKNLVNGAYVHGELVPIQFV